MQLALDFEQFDQEPKDSKKAATDVDAAAVKSAEEQPNPVDAPDKEATDAAAATEVAKAEKKASIVPGTSPILDESISLVGISNKAHKKTINLIQVIYCKTVTNALV